MTAQQAADRAAALADDPGYASLRSSLATYYGDVDRTVRMDDLLAAIVGRPSLSFDIGSHVGDRIGALRRAGGKVVAVEPQPLCASAIQAMYRDDTDVLIVNAACGRAIGTLPLRVNLSNPTVATLSDAFVAAARDADGWREQVWSETLDVPVTTLDALIDEFGTPDFVKIDVEGYEADVLAGLSQALPLISFEFTLIQRDVAEAALARLATLGRYEFNAALGESHQLVWPTWKPVADVRAWLLELPAAANSGDIYARLRDEATC